LEPTKEKENTKELKMFYETHTARKPPKSRPGSNGMVPSAAARRHLQRARSISSLQVADGSAERVLSLVTLTFDLDLQTHPSEGPNTSSL